MTDIPFSQVSRDKMAEPLHYFYYLLYLLMHQVRGCTQAAPSFIKRAVLHAHACVLRAHANLAPLSVGPRRSADRARLCWLQHKGGEFTLAEEDVFNEAERGIVDWLPDGWCECCSDMW